MGGWAGTSAGAIQAALLAVGYSAQEIIDVVNATPIQRLNDGQFIFFGGTHRLVKQYGWYRGDAFSRYLRKLVARKTQRPDLTLGELHALALAQPGRFRDLYTTGTNPHAAVHAGIQLRNPPHHARGRCCAHQHEHSAGTSGPCCSTPMTTLSKASPGPASPCRCSWMVACWPTTRCTSSTSPSYLPAGLPPGTTANPETLGLRLDRAEQIALDTLPSGRQALAPYDIHDFPSYIGALYTVALENLNPALPSDWPRTISINTLGFAPKVKRVSAGQKAQLVASGRAGVQEFFSRRN